MITSTRDHNHSHNLEFDDNNLEIEVLETREQCMHYQDDKIHNQKNLQNL